MMTEGLVMTGIVMTGTDMTTEEVGEAVTRGLIDMTGIEKTEEVEEVEEVEEGTIEIDMTTEEGEVSMDSVVNHLEF
jgi:hypothetical protein